MTLEDQYPERLETVRLFNNRSTQHSRKAWVCSNRRKFCISTFVGVVCAVTLILTFDGLRTNAARRYATALNWQQRSKLLCSAALGRRRLWFFGVVTSTDLCAVHYSKEKYYNRNESGVRFLVVGDWGRDGMCCQHDVAMEMAQVAKFAKPGPSFVVSTGDNFYETGVESSVDEQIDRSWRDVYVNRHKPLQLPWKAVLGNHDYLGNVMAQTDLGRFDQFWHMPETYYFETIGSGDQEIFMAFIDTNVLYYMEKQFKLFKSRLSLSYRDSQVSKLREALRNSRAPWKLVFGHHPLLSSGDNFVLEPKNQEYLTRLLLPILTESKVAAYFCGHEHLMEHLILDGIHQFIAGGGSQLDSIAANHEEAVFVLDRQGFINAIVRNDVSIMTVSITDMYGSIVYKVNIPRPR